ncbi:WD40 repeat domain-containing serine/threonine protein kinase [Streptomyces sp. NBC_01716]|uniref:WD40 repeat domain-containing serine/threonine protein kinase n=1 Tax=Streptomyces sp. NBC_01716 TaxID=2975917 RepID=UPI002E3394E4|nr:WD40 repeat domain-containing serine/threonine protein kinase [Streptomyces sp. NBC_01716]
MTTPLTPEDPERLGDYWIASRLGSGGQGVVYEAYDRGGARVAVKALRRDATQFVWDRFGKEAEAARKVAPFCTARILDVALPPANGAGHEGAVPYIVSEYIPGPTLTAHVQRRGPLDPDAVLRLAIGAATAVAAIHSAGVIHRDLKPGNILLGPDGPRIIDFGIARAADMSLTDTGALMGTLGYMAPEVLSGKRATTASDVFAWGAVVLFAASGDEPFRGAHLGEVAHRTASVHPDLGAVPARFRPLVAAALAKDPELRPSAQELLSDLIGGPSKAVDPRRALLEAGARRATSREDVPPSAETVPPLGERAEAAFGSLPPASQLAAHELLLRLVVPGDAVDGSQDSVRTASQDELYAGRPDSERRAIQAAVTVLADAGVLEADGEDGSVRPVSAALVPAWSRLRDAVDADRQSLVVHRSLGRAARQWLAHGERPDDLPHGTALRTFLDWLAVAPFHLRPNPLELRFLHAAREGSARAARRRRQLLSVTAALTVLALLAGTVAWFQSRESARRGAEAELRRDQATSRSVAQAADNLRGSSPDTALLLSLAAWRIARTPEARSSLSAAATQQETGVIDVPSPSSSPDNGEALLERGLSFMTYTEDETRFWDLTKGQEGVTKPRLTVAGAMVNPPTPPLVSRDGRLLLKKGTSGTYQLVSTRDGKPSGKPVPRQPGFRPDQLSNQGHVLFVQESPPTDAPVTHRFFSPATGLVSWTTEKSSGMYLSPDGTHFASCPQSAAGGSGEPLTVWAIRPGDAEPRFVFSSTSPASRFDDVRVTCGGELDFSADGSLLGLRDGGSFFVWSTADGLPRAGTSIETLDETNASVYLSAGGHYALASSQEHPIAVWALDGSSVPLFRLADRSGNKDGSNSGGFRMGLDEKSSTLTYLDSGSQQVHRLDLTAALSGGGQGPAVEGAAISADGRTGLYRQGVDAPVQHVFDARTGKESGTPLPQSPGLGEAAQTRVSALSPDGSLVAFTDFRPSGGDLRLSVSVWDRRARKELLRAPVPEQRDVFEITISRDNRHIAFSNDYAGVPSGEGGAIDVWDIRDRRRVHRFAQGQHGFGQFSRDSRRLVTTEGDVLDLATRTNRRAAFGNEDTVDLAHSPDGKVLAVVRATGWVELWDSEVRHRLARMPSSTVRGGTRSGAYLSDTVFSPDGTLLAATVETDTVQLWDVDARLSLGQPLDMGGREIDAMAFDGSVLRALSGSRAQSVDLAPDALAVTVCKKAGRDITREEWRTYIPDLPYHGLC